MSVSKHEGINARCRHGSPGPLTRPEDDSVYARLGSISLQAFTRPFTASTE